MPQIKSMFAYRADIFIPSEFYRQKQEPTFQLPTQKSAFVVPKD